MGAAGAAAETQTQLERATAALGRSVATLTIPERALIVAESLETPIDPVRFADGWGLERRSTRRHFRRLAELGFLRVIGDGRSKGGRKPVLYSATQNLLYRGRDWEELSQEDREAHSFVVFITLMSRISLAINAKTNG